MSIKRILNVPGRQWARLLKYNYLYLSLVVLAVPLGLNIALAVFSRSENALFGLMPPLSLWFLVAIGFWLTFDLARESGQPSKYHRLSSLQLARLASLARHISKVPVWVLMSLGVLFTTLILFWVQSVFGFPVHSAGDWWLLYVPIVILPSWQLRDDSTLWLVVALTAAAVGYAILAWAGHLLLDAVSVVDPLSDVFWLVFIAGLLHLPLRHLYATRNQADVVHQVTRELRNRLDTIDVMEEVLNGEPDEELNQIAHLIGNRLHYDRVHIVLRDGNQSRLYIKGAHGVDERIWPTQGWPLGDNKSICSWVIQHGEAHLCRDTHSCDLYFELPGFTCRSEITVPIFLADPKSGRETCIGALDIEASLPNAFGEDDLRVVKQVAEAMGLAVTNRWHVRRQIEAANDKLAKALLEISSARDLDEAIRRAGARLREAFDADLLVLYEHAIGTSLPLPTVFHDGPSVDEEFLESCISDRQVPAEHRTMALLPKGFYVSAVAETDEILLGPNGGEYSELEMAQHGRQYRFIRREGIKSVAYITLRLGDDIIASVFLNFRQRQTFSPTRQNNLKAFAKALAAALIARRQIERLRGPLSGSAALEHSQAQLAYELLRRLVSQATGQLSTTLVTTNQAKNPIEALPETMAEFNRHWFALMITERRDLQQLSLSDWLAHLQTTIARSYLDTRLEFKIHPSADYLPLELRRTAARIVAEAISNGLVHGQARHIRVQADCRNNCFELRISNDGKVLAPDFALGAALSNTQRNRKLTGLLALLMDAERWHGATYSMEPERPQGTLVQVRMPYPDLDVDEEP